jgi:hypothetical protein
MSFHYSYIKQSIEKLTNHGLGHIIAEAQPRYCHSEIEHVIHGLGLSKLSTSLYRENEARLANEASCWSRMYHWQYFLPFQV